MWLRHWGLAHDPFAGAHSPYVPLPSHDEALARLVFSIERPQRHIALFADPGLGKTTVIKQAIKETRDPRRRAVMVHAPTDGDQLPGRLADGLGLPFAVGSDRDGVWRALARKLGAAALEGYHVVFIVDGWDKDPGPATMQDLTALMDAVVPRGSPPSLIRVGRGTGDERDDTRDSWTAAIGLDRLTRSESETYLEAKLGSAGCRERIFTPRAVSRLHSWSEGVPRTLEEIATFALVAGAVQGREVVTPDVVDGVALRSRVGINPDVTAR